MDGSILHMNSRQQMEQLDFRKRRVMMVGAVCRSLEWMRMDNRRERLNPMPLPVALLSRMDANGQSSCHSRHGRA